MKFKNPWFCGNDFLKPLNSESNTFSHFSIEHFAKGQLFSKANCQAVNSSIKQMNEFVFTTLQRVFICFMEEIEDTKKAFRN